MFPVFPNYADIYYETLPILQDRAFVSAIAKVCFLKKRETKREREIERER